MTTNTTNSQAASIDTPEFRQLLGSLYKRTSFNYEQPNAEMLAIIAHIDAKLRNAASMGYLKASEDHKELLDGYGDRAIAAESRLAEIQRGVEGLTRYASHKFPDASGQYVERDDVLALLQPQGHASDTSGLPG